MTDLNQLEVIGEFSVGPFLKIQEVTPHNGERNFRIMNKNGICLGYLNFHKVWRTYVYTSPTSYSVILDPICMRDILAFVEGVKKGDY